MQNAPKISPVDQFEFHFVATSWSKPKTKMQNGCLTDDRYSLNQVQVLRGEVWQKADLKTKGRFVQACAAWCAGTFIRLLQKELAQTGLVLTPAALVTAPPTHPPPPPGGLQIEFQIHGGLPPPKI